MTILAEEMATLAASLRVIVSTKKYENPPSHICVTRCVPDSFCSHGAEGGIQYAVHVGKRAGRPNRSGSEVPRRIYWVSVRRLPSCNVSGKEWKREIVLYPDSRHRLFPGAIQRPKRTGNVLSSRSVRS